MTEIDAIRHAGAVALKMGYPWSLQEVRATRRHFWPFPAHWTVECEVRRPRGTVRIRFRDADGVVTFSGVVYPKHGGRHSASGQRRGSRRSPTADVPSKPADMPETPDT